MNVHAKKLARDTTGHQYQAIHLFMLQYVVLECLWTESCLVELQDGVKLIAPEFHVSKYLRIHIQE